MSIMPATIKNSKKLLYISSAKNLLFKVLSQKNFRWVNIEAQGNTSVGLKILKNTIKNPSEKI